MIELVTSSEKAIAWEIANRIDQLAHEHLPWTERLEAIGNLLLQEVGGDAVWVLTLHPLQVGASGILKTPLKAEPNAVISLTDAFPPISEQWPPEGSALGNVLKTGRPLYARQSNGNQQNIDHDLADVLLNTFNITVRAIIPIRIGSQSTGVLMIGSQTDVHFPNQQTEALLEYLGQHLGLALHNAQLVETARRQAEQLTTLNRIARTISSSLNLDEIIQRTMAGINEILDVEAGSLLLLDERTNELYFKITLRGENQSVTSFRLKPGQGIAGWVVQNQRPALVNDTERDPRFYSKIDEAIGFTTNSVLCTPLIVQGNPIGALEVINKRSGPFTSDDQELLTSMTASLAIALRNAHLFDEVQERAQRTEIINNITTIINSSTDLNETAGNIIKQLKRLFRFNRAVLALLDDSKQHLSVFHLDEIGLHEANLSPIPIADSGLQPIIQRDGGLLIKDLHNAANFPEWQKLSDERMRSTMIVPLKLRDELTGTLTLISQEADVYQPDDLELLDMLSPSLTMALQKARFIGLTEQRANELRMLNRLGEMLALTTDTSLVLERAFSFLPRLISADVHGLLIAEEEGVRIRIAVPYAARGRLRDTIRNDLLTAFSESRRGGSPVVLLEAEAVAGNIPVADDWQPAATLTLPIITRVGCLGVVHLVSGRESVLGHNQLRLLSLFVAQLSATLENAYLFRQVEQERGRLAGVLSSTADAILVVNRQGRIVLDNPAAMQVLGANGSQVDQPLRQVTSNAALLALFERARQAGRAVGEVPTAGDKTFYAVISPVSGGEAEVIGWVAALQDVTHFKELDQIKSDFVNAVSHDLRSPLSGIGLACHMLSQVGELNERQQEFLGTIKNRVEAMTDLINELLDVGKIEAGIDMNMEPCGLEQVVEESISALKDEARRKNISLAIDIAPELPQVQGNATRLGQAVGNLIGNAIKYTPENGQVKVRLFHDPAEGIVFQVEDNGPGIPKADQPRVFDKFYRVRGEHMIGKKGSGLGLAITKTILAKHRGKIWVDSEFGQGSTFTFCLPSL
ncbi:MAG: GAF domain-containing protein [Anaerolineae bacterium]